MVIWEGSRENPKCTVGSSLICTLFHPFCFDNLSSSQWPSGNGFPARLINSYGSTLSSHIIFWLCFSLVQTPAVGAVKVKNARLAGHNGCDGSEAALTGLWSRFSVSHTEIRGLQAHKKHRLISPGWGMSRTAAPWIAVQGICTAKFHLYIMCVTGFLNP